MPKEIFDQDRPRSAMAQRLDDAFAGCEEWTIVPPSERRGADILVPDFVVKSPDTEDRRHPRAA
jgi:hypothetical protein